MRLSRPFPGAGPWLAAVFLAQLHSGGVALGVDDIVAYGDSITAGVPYHDRDCYGKHDCGGYEPPLVDALAAHNMAAQVLNYGIPGEVTGAGKTRLGRVLSDTSPRHVLLMEGTNDLFWLSPESVTGNLRKMVDDIMAWGSTPIIATITPDTRGGKPISHTNDLIREIASDKHIPLADQYRAVAGNWNNLHSGDKLHPNQEGYRIIGETWFKSIPEPCDDYDSFTDVCAGYWAFVSIERLHDAGVTGGCQADPPMFCPEDHVKRSEMAAFIGRARHGAGFFPPAATGKVFDDVPKSLWTAAWIEQFKDDGITSGCSTNPPEYCPEGLVDRAQMSIFLLKAKHGSSYRPPAATGAAFADVPKNYWAEAWIEQLVKEGITGGCGGGNFCPTDSVTRAQMSVFLVRTFDL